LNFVLRSIYHPIAPLVAFSIALAALLTIYLAAWLSPSPAFEFVASFWWSVLLAIWIVADARRRSGVPCFDFGFFCYLFLPVAVPWYCFWSRGWRGMLTLLSIVGIWLAPYVVAGLVWEAMYG
jgi:hypothetical protein